MRRGFGKMYTLMAMCLVSANVMAQDISTRIMTGNVAFLDNVIETEQIVHFSKHDLRILRNTIFARYGYAFVSEDLKSHFSAFRWYDVTKSDVQNDLNATDWINIAIIQSLEDSDEVCLQNVGSFGEHLILADKIYPYKRISEEPGEVNIGGEIIARVNGAETTRAKIIDNEFQLSLGNVSFLRHWESFYDKGVLQCSDPETRTAYLDLLITGAEIRITTQAEGSGRYSVDEIRPGNFAGYYDEFSYIYSDRDAVIRGVDHREDPGLGKLIYNISLKKGWNKIKHYKSEIKGFANYKVDIIESTLEKGRFEIYYFDTVDYLNSKINDYLNNNNSQLTMLEGKIVLVNSNTYYFVLKKPIKVRVSSDEERSVRKLLLWVDPVTFPTRGNYVLFGEIEHFTISGGDVIFSVIEVGEKKQNTIGIIMPAILFVGISIGIFLILKRRKKAAV
jgi:hypothetical protein